MSAIDRPAYDTLRIKPDSNLREVRKGYKNLIREFTPEKSPDKFSEINLAYRTVIGEVEASSKMDKEGIHPITRYPMRRFEEIFSIEKEDESTDILSPLKSIPESIFNTKPLLDSLLEGFIN